MSKSVFMRYPNGLSKALTLSYDDGVADDLKMMEILDRYGIKCTFNVNSGRFPEVNATGSRLRLSGTQIKEIFANSPHEVAVHAYEHPFLTNQDQATVCLEVIRDRVNLEQLTGTIVRGMAYPYGACNDSVVEALRCCGIAYARTTVSTEKFDLPTDWLRMPATCRHKNPKLMELAESFVNSNFKYDPKLFYLWGHTFEFTDDNNWDVIERFAEYMGGREEIWYATNIEIYEYIKDYERLVWSVDGSIVHNPTARTLWFAYGSKLIMLESGETKNLNA